MNRTRFHLIATIILLATLLLMTGVVAGATPRIGGELAVVAGGGEACQEMLPGSYRGMFTVLNAMEVR
jgi:hypothetical protein